MNIKTSELVLFTHIGGKRGCVLLVVGGDAEFGNPFLVTNDDHDTYTFQPTILLHGYSAYRNENESMAVITLTFAGSVLLSKNYTSIVLQVVTPVLEVAATRDSIDNGGMHAEPSA